MMMQENSIRQLPMKEKLIEIPNFTLISFHTPTVTDNSTYKPTVLADNIATDIDVIRFTCQVYQFCGVDAKVFLILQHLSPCNGCWEIWLSSGTAPFLITIKVVGSKSPNAQMQGPGGPHPTNRGVKTRKCIFAIKQSKICAEYQDVLWRPRLVRTFGMRPTASSQGPVSI